jgi:hypothetical protein
MKFNKAMFDYVKEAYRLPFLKAGMRVEINGKPGVVVGRSNSGLTAKMDDRGKELAFHPTWETVYYGEDMSIVADFRRQQLSSSSK